LTSTCNPKINNSHLKATFIRVPPISFLLSTQYLKKNFKENYLSYILLLPLNLTIGLIWDLIERLVLKRIGGGIWSWTPSVVMSLMFMSPFLKVDIILSTGGPTSALLGASLYGYFSKIKTISELQDPLVGESIGNNNSVNKLKIVEKILVKTSSKLVFVTRTAFEEAKKRYSNSKTLYYIYTSSRKLEDNISKINSDFSRKINLIHLGTLYGSRNFDNIIEALENIKKDYPGLEINLKNIGTSYVETKDSKNISVHFKNKISRWDLHKFIDESTLVLLIQHTDGRSLLTIPYKTWDYLNMRIPILGLTNNQELDTILNQHGNISANCKNTKEIKDTIEKIILKKHTFNIVNNKYDLVNQLEKLIKIDS